MIDPRGLTALKWMNFSRFPLEEISPSIQPLIPKVEADWVRWALDVIEDPQIASYHPPDPRFFRTWSDWAMRFNQCFNG